MMGEQKQQNHSKLGTTPEPFPPAALNESNRKKSPDPVVDTQKLKAPFECVISSHAGFLAKLYSACIELLEQLSEVIENPPATSIPNLQKTQRRTSSLARGDKQEEARSPSDTSIEDSPIPKGDDSITGNMGYLTLIRRLHQTLKLWGNGYGVLDGHLDDKLQYSSRLRGEVDATYESKYTLSSFLEDAGEPLTDNGIGNLYSVTTAESFVEMLEDIRTDIECLVDLTPALDCPAEHPETADWTSRFAYSLVFESRHPFVERMENKFPNADARLIERLATRTQEQYLRLSEERRANRTYTSSGQDICCLDTRTLITRWKSHKSAIRQSLPTTATYKPARTPSVISSASNLFETGFPTPSDAALKVHLSRQHFSMGWFWADTSAPSAPIAPHPLPSSNASPPPGCPMHKSSSPPSPPSRPPTSDGACPYNPPPPSSPSTNTTASASPPRPSSSNKTLSALNPLNYMPTTLSQSRESPHQTRALPLTRETSTIPKGDGPGNWEYPSPQQMYNAMIRKGYMDTPEDAVEAMVAVHNFLNEGAWGEIREWERRFGRGLRQGWRECARGEEGLVLTEVQRGRGAREELELEREVAVPEPRLVRFMGRPNDLTPKAYLQQLLAHVAPARFSGEPPFDRHDWYVSRRSPDGSEREVRYVIDYYSGPPEETGEPVFFLDVRPAVDGPTSAAERAIRWGGDMWWRASGGRVREALAKKERMTGQKRTWENWWKEN
ncbi:MAG: hypothetical protein Q9165_003054 [Trypethelium subeluteriae]